MNLPAAKPVLTVFFSCFLTSCVSTPITDQEQDESFSRYEELAVGGVSMREFVLRRSAFVFAADQLVVDGAEGTSTEGKVRFKMGEENMAIASAAAVDRRGYLVTAAHCVDHGDIYLGFTTPSDTNEFRKARIVWAGDSTSVNGFDFALVHVASSLDHVLKWSPTLEKGAAVISAGVRAESDESSDPELNLSMDPFGGTILKIFNKEHEGIGYNVIVHDTPIVKGNSGGPLIGEDGQLLGINYAGRSPNRISLFPDARLTGAVRPDPDWLAELIEKDHAESLRKAGR